MKAIGDEGTSFTINTHQMSENISCSSQASIAKYHRLDDLTKEIYLS